MSGSRRQMRAISFVTRAAAAPTGRVLADGSVRDNLWTAIFTADVIGTR